MTINTHNYNRTGAPFRWRTSVYLLAALTLTPIYGAPILTCDNLLSAIYFTLQYPVYSTMTELYDQLPINCVVNYITMSTTSGGCALGVTCSYWTTQAVVYITNEQSDGGGTFTYTQASLTNQCVSFPYLNLSNSSDALTPTLTAPDTLCTSTGTCTSSQPTPCGNVHPLPPAQNEYNYY